MVMTDEVKQKIRDFYGAVSSNLPGFKARAGQRQMIACAATTIANALGEDDERDGSNICIIEGRTGVGKTVGYLVPSLVMALELEKTLVVSSATVALQEQLIDRDIPAVLQFFPEQTKIKVVLAKGRNRYACTTKLKQITNTGNGDDMFGDAVWERPPRPDETEILFKLAKQIDGDWSGDRDELEFSVNDDLWQRITNDSHGCPGRTCPSFDNCPFVKSRIKMRAANVIVANHDFLLTSMKSESKALPHPSDCIFVFDECHHLPDIAVRRFAVSHSLRGAISWIEKMGAANAKILITTKNQVAADDLETSLKLLSRSLSELQDSIEHSNLFEQKPIYRYPHGQLDEGMTMYASDIFKFSEKALTCAGAILQFVEEMRKLESAPAEALNKIQSDMGFFVGRLENLVATWSLFSKEASSSPLAKWLELKDDDILVSASPLNAAEALDSIIWSSASAVVLASATVTTLGDFQYFFENTGLSKYPGVVSLAVRSPFNFQEQGQIFLPRMRSNPKDSSKHTQEIISVMPSMLTEYMGSLVLFSSKRQMMEVYEAMLANGNANTVLVQGQYPKREIIRIHTEKINAGQRSVIFGLASMGEGVDLRGELCSQVIITKIPFAPPDTPIEMAMQEWVESKGGNSFNEVSLPKAGLKLTQWVGRLIRSETDFGRIVFLDSRMGSSAYSNRLIASLPEFSIVRGVA
jgi:ATP-dependent DNA helicase DinG